MNNGNFKTGTRGILIVGFNAQKNTNTFKPFVKILNILNKARFSWRSPYGIDIEGYHKDLCGIEIEIPDIKRKIFGKYSYYKHQYPSNPYENVSEEIMKKYHFRHILANQEKFIEFLQKESEHLR